MTKLAIIIPCYNSEHTIGTVVDSTISVLDNLGQYDYQIVLVNDCSKDNSYEVICELAKQKACVLGIDLAHNTGQHNALIAGLHYADADLYLGLDDDMQTHPSQIGKLIDKLNEGYDVVYGAYRETKKKQLYRRLGSSFNNYTVSTLLGKPRDMRVSSFWIARRFVRDEVIRGESRFTNLLGLFLRSTNKITNVEIEYFDRISGSSGYTIIKLIRQWSSVLNYSSLPLRLPLASGALLLLLAVIHIILLIVFRASWNVEMHIFCILFELIASSLFVGLGMIGEYIGRMFRVVTHDPQFVVRQTTE